ncbi:MAG: 3-oxoacyl-ACP reductase FabG [Bacteriovoracaceae bacterium]
MNPIFPDLKNKKILITGATRGIGKSIALSLAAQGSHIIFNYREGKEDVAKELQAELKNAGAADAHYVEFDVNNTEQMKENLNNLIKEIGPFEGLVNNAGISKDTLALRLKEEELGRILDTNLKSAILLTSHLTRSFLKAENVSIVNMSSVVGLMGNPSQIAYAASKAGMIGFTKSYAKELSSKNIRCNAVCPGFIATDMTAALEEKAKDVYLDAIPLKRFGDSQEVANLVSFLLSNASAYITGETLKIDGGLYI